MSRLARRCKTKWIKGMKKRGFKWFGGKLWRVHRWTISIPFDMEQFKDG